MNRFVIYFRDSKYYFISIKNNDDDDGVVFDILVTSSFYPYRHLCETSSLVAVLSCGQKCVLTIAMLAGVNFNFNISFVYIKYTFCLTLKAAHISITQRARETYIFLYLERHTLNKYKQNIDLWQVVIA